MNKLSLLLFGLALLQPCACFAQSVDLSRPPSPPFLAPTPDNSTWTISVRNSDTTAKLPPGIKVVNKFISTKSGSTRELVSIWTDGSQSQVWFWQGYRLEQSTGNSEIMVMRVPSGHDYQDADFFGLAWLRTSNYVGLEEQGGKDCYHFKTEVKMVKPPVTINYSAYIDPKTKRPVAWDIASNHFELTSVELRKPEDRLTLPEAFAEQLKAYRLAARAMNPYKKQ